MPPHNPLRGAALVALGFRQMAVDFYTSPSPLSPRDSCKPPIRRVALRAQRTSRCIPLQTQGLASEDFVPLRLRYSAS